MITIPEAGWPVVIAAAIALTGVTFSAIISLSVARRGNYLTSVTAERSKWIDKLRTNIAELAALCVVEHFKYTRHHTAHDRSPEQSDALQRIETLAATIHLQLNPEAIIDSNIIRILDRIHHLPTMGDYSVFSAHWLLIRHSQYLLKEEWDTVKAEASGWGRRAFIAAKRRRRRREYSVFCADEGSLADIGPQRREGECSG